MKMIGTVEATEDKKANYSRRKDKKNHEEWNVCDAVGKGTWLKPKQSGTRAKSG